MLGNDDVRIAYVVTGTEPSPLYRNAIGDECVFVEAGTRHRRVGLRRRGLPHRRLRRHPARDHPPLGARPSRAGSTPSRRTATSPRRSATSRASGSSSSTRPTASATCTGRRAAARRGPTDVEVLVKHRTERGHRRHPDDLRDAPVRRGRLGRLPLPLHVQHRRLRADHRQGAPAAAGAPGLRGPELRDLQLPAAQGRLPPARDPGALLPLQRRLRRGHVLRRRRLRGAQGLGHRHRLDLAAPGRLRPRPAAVGDRGVARARSTSTSRPSWSTRSRPLELGEGGLAVEDPAYAWTWAGRGPDDGGGPAVFSNS